MSLNPTPPTADGRAGLPDLAVLGTDDLLAKRVGSMLSASGNEMPVRTLADPLSSDIDDDEAPDVLVIWAGRGITSRDALLHRLSARLPSTYFVVIGPLDSPSSVRAAIEAGAHGIVFETDAPTALGPTIMAVLAGQVSVPAQQRRGLGTPDFTPREKQILGLVVLGLSNHEIGTQLFLADSTVKSHLSSVFAKLGVRSRHEAVKVILDPAQRLGLGILGISDSAQRAIEVPA